MGSETLFFYKNFVETQVDLEGGTFNHNVDWNFEPSIVNNMETLSTSIVKCTGSFQGTLGPFGF